MQTTIEAAPDRRRRPGTPRPPGHAIREGIIIGLLGAFAVMLAFFVVDLAAGAPFRTPGTLGSALFHGSRGPDGAMISASTVLGYTVVHLLGFVGFGLAVSGLFALAERENRVLSLVFLVACCLAVAGILAAYFVSLWMGDPTTSWLFLIAHILAGGAMVAALFFFHRTLLRQFPNAIE